MRVVLIFFMIFLMSCSQNKKIEKIRDSAFLKKDIELFEKFQKVSKKTLPNTVESQLNIRREAIDVCVFGKEGTDKKIVKIVEEIKFCSS